MKKNAIVIFLIALITATFSLAGCDFFEQPDQKEPDTSSTDDFVRDEEQTFSTVNLTVTDPALYQQYTEQSLAQVIERIRNGVVGVNVITNNATAFGSGIVIANSDDGKYSYIATSHTLIASASSVYVDVYGKETVRCSATPVGTDPITDVCVIKVEQNLTPAVFYTQSNKMVAGESVVSVCNLFGSQQVVCSHGIISAAGFSVDVGEGNSNSLLIADFHLPSSGLGGGLFTEKGGFLAGMFCNTAIKTTATAFVLPADELQSVCSEIIQKGFVEGRYKLGFTAVDNRSGWGITESVSIAELATDGCLYASGAGLKVGDIINSFSYEGTEYAISYSEDLYFYLYSFEFKIGDQLEFSVERNGTNTKIKITIRQYDYFDLLV
ncbi:MAG: serine protease [Clostridia bacterium]|nr:serine protease [Clostridia bacterium]